MFNKEIRYGYNDVMLQPATVSYVEHRSECNPFKSVNILGGEKSMLPIFTAPMSTVVDDENADLFIKNSIIPIVPRNIPIEKRIEMLCNGYWVALSMTEFETYLTDKDIVYTNPIHTLIDVANGHMEKIFQVSKKAKEIHKNIEIMAGNIANPATYEKYCEAGIDYVRVGIGGGSGCIVSGTDVITKEGIKKIEDIDVGDMLKTHNNNFKEVTSFITYKNTKELLRINNEVTCTKNHKFYVVNKSDKDSINDDNIKDYAYWVEADKLDKKKHFLIKSV